MPMFTKKERVDTDVYTLAKERTHKTYDLFDTVVVSFSGGKDSTACLGVAREVLAERKERGEAPPDERLNVLFYDEEAIPYETEEYQRRVAALPDINLLWYCLPLKHRNACSRRYPEWYPWAPEDRDLWCRPMPDLPCVITDVRGERFEDPTKRMHTTTIINTLFDPAIYGRVGIIMGIRSDESLVRYRAVAQTARIENYIIQHSPSWGGKVLGDNFRNIWKAYTIYDWSTRDVWTAPAKFGWDYNRSYDLLDKAGISPSQQRLSPPFGDETIESDWAFRTCFPDIWEKMVYRVPGAATAIRYAGTDLYGFGNLPPKPPNLSYPEWIRSFLLEHGPEMRKATAHKIRTWIHMHYSKTDDPILPKATHPDTGISYFFLAQIALRGDPKDRKQPGARVYPDADDPARIKAVADYNKERLSLRDGA